MIYLDCRDSSHLCWYLSFLAEGLILSTKVLVAQRQFPSSHTDLWHRFVTQISWHWFVTLIRDNDSWHWFVTWHWFVAHYSWHWFVTLDSWHWFVTLIRDTDSSWHRFVAQILYWLISLFHSRWLASLCIVMVGHIFHVVLWLSQCFIGTRITKFSFQLLTSTWSSPYFHRKQHMVWINRVTNMNFDLKLLNIY